MNQKNEKQQFISNLWLTKSEAIDAVDNAYDLTALVCGKTKHEAEVASIDEMNFLSKKTRLLDLACGNGRLCKHYSGQVHSVTGTDLCPSFIESLKHWEKENQVSNTSFSVIDLLEPSFSRKIEGPFCAIFLFGTSQFIISDKDLLSVFRNTWELLAPQGFFLIKQTTSTLKEDVEVDHLSGELKERWVAKYRTVTNMKEIIERVGFKVELIKEVYDRNALGEEYEKIERWDNTRQMYFLLRKTHK